MTLNIEVTEFDPRSAAEAEFIANNAFINRINAEIWPDDPPQTLDETKRNYRAVPAFWTPREWLVRDAAGEVIANATVGWPEVEENRHLAESWIGVMPEWRRQGVATRLLRLVAERARDVGRTMLLASSFSTVPAGEAFLARMGAKMGMAGYSNQLRIGDLNRELVRTWLERARILEPEFELGLWVGPYPEERLEAIARLRAVMNTAPRDELDVEDQRPTAGHIRQSEESMTRRGIERWSMYVQERSTENLVGFTEVYWNALRPDFLGQGDTGVFPEYRERGIGTWLKAAMLERVLRDRPEVRLIRTGNAQSNAPMLSINSQLGFRPYLSRYAWQVEVSRVLDDLSA